MKTLKCNRLDYNSQHVQVSCKGDERLDLESALREGLQIAMQTRCSIFFVSAIYNKNLAAIKALFTTQIPYTFILIILIKLNLNKIVSRTKMLCFSSSKANTNSCHISVCIDIWNIQEFGPYNFVLNILHARPNSSYCWAPNWPDTMYTSMRPEARSLPNPIRPLPAHVSWEAVCQPTPLNHWVPGAQSQVAKYFNLHKSTQRSNKLPAPKLKVNKIPGVPGPTTAHTAKPQPAARWTGRRGRGERPQCSVTKLVVTQFLMQIAKVMALECFGYCLISMPFSGR